LGENHEALKSSFTEANPKRLESQGGGFQSLPPSAAIAGKVPEASEPPAPKKTSTAKKELTEEQKEALKAAGLDF